MLFACTAVVLLVHLPTTVEAVVEELFTTNAVCQQRYCVNPVFPGYGALPALENERWVKQNLTYIFPFMEFCGNFINYDPALPMNVTDYDPAYPTEKEPRLVSLDDALERATRSDRAAAETFFMHLSGMGLEAWDHADPWAHSGSPHKACVESVARMSCLTHFPEAPVFARPGQEVGYMRPCSGFCESFLQVCQVECCDESVSCVFERPLELVDDGSSTEEAKLANSKRMGYVDSSSPTAICSGSAITRKAALDAVSLLENTLGKSAASCRFAAGPMLSLFVGVFLQVLYAGQ